MEKIQPVVMAKRLEMWPLERLRPYERNARTHSDEQLQQIAASIREFGFTAPILVDGSDGVVAGHGRLAAAKLLGLAEVPVVVLDHLSEEQRRQYVLADNKLAENAGWDLELLALELEAIDIDPAVLGFGEADLARLQDGLELGEFEQVPTVQVGLDPVHRMMSTIRHNRARGAHAVVRMADIVRQMTDEGIPAAEIQKRLGMEREEVVRLVNRAGMPTQVQRSAPGLNRAWVPGKG